MKSYLKYRALVYDPTANRQWESVNSLAEERLLLTRASRLDGCARATSPARRPEYPLSRFTLGDGASHRMDFRNSSTRPRESKFLGYFFEQTN